MSAENNNLYIRKATPKDVSRIAEILVFTRRMNYRRIFHNDQVSFGEIQVYPLVLELLNTPSLLEQYWVYDDGFVKGLAHIDGEELKELYVDTFFENQSIGSKLIDFACTQMHCKHCLVLEKNTNARRFYERHGFVFSGKRVPEEGTPEYLLQMIYSL